MDVRFVAPDLRKLDALKSEALTVHLFEDERPLRGALGLVDWRLCGQVSRLILAGRIRGVQGERVLIPARPKLPFEKLFLFGLGRREDFDEEVFAQATAEVLDTLGKARVRASVCVLPGGSVDVIPKERCMERFLSIALEHGDQDEVTLVEDAEAQRVMAPIVARERRRARASSP